MSFLRAFVVVAVSVVYWQSGPQPANGQQHVHRPSNGSHNHKPGELTPPQYSEPCNMTPEQLENVPDMQPGETCRDTVTGQFWYKICVPEHDTMEWHCCWVYDPVNCCNVLKKTRVPIHHDGKETLVCVKMTVRVADIKGLPKCDCPDVPVPFKTSSTCPLHKPGAMMARLAEVKAGQTQGTRVDTTARRSVPWDRTPVRSATNRLQAGN